MTASVFRFVLIVFALVAVVRAQSPCAATEPAKAANSPQFYDEPNFTVAGVADASQMGGHGSDTVRRMTESLTKDTVALQGANPAASGAAPIAAQTAKEPDDAAGHHARADAEEKAGHPLTAEREYQRAAELEPSESNLFDWGAELLLHRAYEPAGEVFAKGHRLFPKSVRMAVGLGVVAYSLASYDTAAQRLCEASEIDPQDALPYMFLGKMQGIDNQRFGEMAGVLLARFVRLQPENAWANYFYAVSLMRQRDARSDEARPLLEKAIRLDPKLALAYLQLGTWYADRKDFPHAIGALENAVRVDSSLEEAHYRLGQDYRMNGQAEKSQVELEIYARISKQKNTEIGAERRGVQQFVYDLRSGAAVHP